MTPATLGDSVAARRAWLVVQCACELLGIRRDAAPAILQLQLSVAEFESELRNRFGAAHPDLVFRTDSTLERARLDRRQMPEVPKVILRQGAPRREERTAERAQPFSAARTGHSAAVASNPAADPQ
jgi:hypothetical protein